MEPTGINYLAVVVAAVVYMIIGALWYSPILFGKAWMAGIGKTKEQVAAGFSPINYLWAILSAFFVSYGVARIMYWTNAYSIADAIQISLLTGVAFIAASMWVTDRFEARPAGLTLINIMYHLVAIVVAGIIIGVWR